MGEAKEVYVAKSKDGPWKSISREAFVRHDGETLCSTTDEITAVLAEREGVPAGCISERNTSGGPQYDVCCASAEHLPFFLEHTKNNGVGIAVRFYLTLADLKRVCSLSVVSLSKYGGHYVIGDSWVLDHSQLIYDPPQAALRLARKEEEVKTERVRRSQFFQRSKISITGFLEPMFRSLDCCLDKVPPFSVKYPGNPAWYSSFVTRVAQPKARVGYILAIPHLAMLCEKLGARNFRTSGWKKLIATLHAEHLKDIAVTKAFRRFIKDEFRRIR